MAEKPKTKGKMKPQTAKSPRDDALKDALRANLHRRKAQARARSADTDKT